MSIELKTLAKVHTSISKEGSSSTRSHSTEAGTIVPIVKKSWASNKWTGLKNSFREKEEEIEDVEANETSASTHKKPMSAISHRHVIMVALAGGLGTGLLVGTGNGLAVGGPVGLLLAFVLIGIMVYLTIGSAGELAVAYSSVPGGFNTYAARLVDPSLSFAVAWNYCINWFTVLPLEMVTASMTIKYWDTDTNSDVYVAIFLIIVCLVNFIGSIGYAEFEFWANLIKVAMLVEFIILGIIMDTGAVGAQGKLSFTYLYDPGAFANGFKGFCAVLVTAAFSLGGSEFMALSAADQANPKKAIPSAVKHVGYRLIIVYLIPIFLIGLLVPYNSSSLMGSGHNNGAPVSPFVLAVEVGSIPVVPHIINAVILIAVLSVGNAALYCSSRTFYSLAQQGYAPSWFNFVDRNDRPTRAMAVSSVLGLFSLIAAYPNQEVIFVWLLSLSGLASLFTWATINISHLRLRAAMKAQGISTNELGYKSTSGVVGSWIAVVIIVIILVCHFWVSLFPFNNNGNPSAKNFFQNYLGLPVLLLFYVSHKIYSRRLRLCIPAQEVDLVTDRKVFNSDVLQQETEEEKARLKTGPFYKRVINFLC